MPEQHSEVVDDLTAEEARKAYAWIGRVRAVQEWPDDGSHWFVTNALLTQIAHLEDKSIGEVAREFHS